MTNTGKNSGTRRRRQSPRRAVPPAGVPSGLREPVAPGDVSLRKGKGSSGRGAGHGGEYWHIDVEEQRVGSVYVNVINEQPFGEHASLQIQISKPWQGRGVGRTAYALAAAASRHRTIYLHMRRSNIASAQAARHAGFQEVVLPGLRQCVMVSRKGEP
ncbi:GNAT family N-acetyltransferase [Amycolatopsis japonica]|uniref:GNAT family N-acetyltransferase n=1 Tax=Amycolatopsis japonica TaxID=208439 RepID=UPI0037AC1494